MKTVVIVSILVSLVVIFFITLMLLCSRKKEMFKKEGIFVSDAKDNRFEVSSEFTTSEWKNVREGQKMMTEMFREFDSICRSNNLKYWAMGGTLLGAVRHNGWIPWDGDIDVGMEEEDLNKFHEFASKQLSSKYFTVNSRFGPDLEMHPGADFGIDKIRCKYGRYSDWDPMTSLHGLQLDMFCIFSDSDGKWKKASYGGEDVYLADNAKEIIFPLKEQMFEGISIMVPRDPAQYFKLWLKESSPSLLQLKDRKPHEGRMSFDVPQVWKDKYLDLYVD